MYKLYVKQTHKYINVNIDKYEEVESPWVPRLSEYFYSLGLQGNIRRIRNTYIREPQVDLTLENVRENKILNGSDLLNIKHYEIIYAYMEGTQDYDRTLIYEKRTPREIGKEFDEEAFDKQFLPKVKKGVFSR